MNTTESNDELAPEWEALLNDGLIRPPAHFDARVMHRVQLTPDNTSMAPSRAASLTRLLQAAAVLVAALAAGWQTLGFVFGLWATTIAV